MNRTDSWEDEYVKSLLARVSSLTSDATAINARVAEIKANPSPGPLEACELELLLLRLKSRDQLTQDLPGLRARLAALDPSSVGPKTTDTSSDPQVLAEASHLVEMIHRSYLLTSQLERTRQQMIYWMVATALFALVLVTFGVYRNSWNVRVVDGVVAAGLLGGFTSCLRRISSVVQGADTVAAIQTLSASRYSMISAPLLGGIFAPLLYICFTGNLVSGVLFPTLTVTPNPAQSTPFAMFLFGTAGGAESEFAKLLVWSFIAGFAERFMPDTIDRLIDKVSAK